MRGSAPHVKRPTLVFHPDMMLCTCRKDPGHYLRLVSYQWEPGSRSSKTTRRHRRRHECVLGRGQAGQVDIGRESCRTPGGGVARGGASREAHTPRIGGRDSPHILPHFPEPRLIGADQNGWVVSGFGPSTHLKKGRWGQRQ